jgi:hypothetical protein
METFMSRSNVLFIAMKLTTELLHHPKLRTVTKVQRSELKNPNYPKINYEFTNRNLFKKPSMFTVWEDTPLCLVHKTSNIREFITNSY